MKTKITAILIIIALHCNSAFALNPRKNLEQPKHKKKELISHLAYSLVVNEKERQTAWVAYELTRDELNKVVERNDKFIADPLAPNSVALKEEYVGTPYDKGHLAPADQMLFSDTAMQESFFMTNMGPQYFSLNRGRWKTLESQTTKWGGQYGSIYITAGPLFLSTIDTIGNNLCVPSHYFKALLIYSDSVQQAVGFVMPNQKIEEKLQFYAISIDSLEQLTKLDLFYRLPWRKEKELEKEFDQLFWFGN